MKTGTIKRLVSDRGFGFIYSQGQDFFFYCSQVPSGFDRLKEEQIVTFEEQDGPKGPMAENVRPA